MTCPARFCMDRLGALATTVSLVSFKPPQNDNIPLHGRRWKAIAKMTLLWKLHGGEFTSNLLSCPLDFVHNFFFLKRTMIISELRGSPGCGCLPSAASYKEREYPQHLRKNSEKSKTLWLVVLSMSGDWKATTTERDSAFGRVGMRATVRHQ